jgi:hypothetical protein
MGCNSDVETDGRVIRRGSCRDCCLFFLFLLILMLSPLRIAEANEWLKGDEVGDEEVSWPEIGSQKFEVIAKTCPGTEYLNRHH